MILGRLAAILHLIFWVENSHADTSTPCWTSGNRSCVGSFPHRCRLWDLILHLEFCTTNADVVWCKDPEPYLLVGLRNGIVLTDLVGGAQKRLVSGVGNGVLVDFHYSEGRVYWVDTHTGVLSRVDLDGTHAQKLLSLGKGISGLAVDWRENSVYWSSRKTGTIRRADTDGHDVKTVLRDLTQPSSVVTDPNTGYVFWLSAGMMSSIQRSDLTGGLITTVLKTSDRLLCLVSDAVERKLFWILQHGANELSSLGSCDYNGNSVNIINQRLSRAKTLKMSPFSDYVYMTDSASQSVIRVKRHMAEPPEEVKAIKMQKVPVDVKVIHPTIQPAVESPAAFTPVCETDGCVNVCSSSDGHCQCKPGFKLSKHGDYCEVIFVCCISDLNECALWNHGCSLGCENIPGSYFCTCPEGYVLLSDHRTCREMKPCVENGTLCEHTCTHTLEGDVCVCPVGSSLKPDGHSCTGPPALMLFGNMVDVRSVNVDGSDSRSLMNESKRSIMAVDYDPVQNRGLVIRHGAIPEPGSDAAAQDALDGPSVEGGQNERWKMSLPQPSQEVETLLMFGVCMVYFADTERRQIEGVSIDGGETEVMITDLISPQGIAVDWTNRRLYWTDRGMFSVSRSRLSGQESTVLIQDKLLQPRDVAVHPHAQTIFWTDVGVPVAVWRAGLDGEDRTVLIGSGLVSPCGITVDHNTHTLYWTDIGAGRIESAGLDGSHRHTLTHEQVALPEGPQGVPRPAERHSLSSVSWVFPGASSRWGMPGTPLQGDVPEASETDARATSTAPFQCGGAAALLRAPPG
ncbi:hypothetical protein QTP86_026407 [Hemibagrus guttatus]|nr:hypothetical protein QTP86_026407 [Hemibagrus guttatus]